MMVFMGLVFNFCEGTLRQSTKQTVGYETDSAEDIFPLLDSQQREKINTV